MLVGVNTTVTSPTTIAAAGQVVTTTDNLKAMLKMYGPMMTGINGEDTFDNVAELKANFTGITTNKNCVMPR